jgi:hypothetical protein
MALRDILIVLTSYPDPALVSVVDRARGHRRLAVSFPAGLCADGFVEPCR